MAPRVLDAIKQDHRDLEMLYNEIVNGKDTGARTRFQNMFAWELARHSVAEDLVLYPAFEKYLSNGRQTADRDREENHVIKEHLKNFQNLDAASPDFFPVLDSLMRDLKKHIHDEETVDIPQLEDAVSQTESEGLAKSFERTKIFAPSRAHPHAPSKPPFETAVNLITAPIDQVADMFRRWPSKKDISIE